MRPTRFIYPLLLLTTALFISGCGTIDSTGTYFQRLTNRVRGVTPLSAARQMEDPDFPDERRNGIDRLSDYPFGREAPYTDRYEQIAQHDADWLVRATAIRALNRSRWTHATPIFIRALNDDNAFVRVEAAKALSNVPDRRAVPLLVHLVGNETEDRDVRIASADALRHYRTMEVGRTLAGQLNDREFAIAWQSRRSLQSLTGKDLRYDESAWLNYFGGPAKPLG